MSLFSTIRDWAGIKSVELTEEKPIDTFERLRIELASAESELKKAEGEYDESSSKLELKIRACDVLIEQGSETGMYNKKVIQGRLDKATDEFFVKASELHADIDARQGALETLEADIIAKSVELTALLSEEERNDIAGLITVWNETKLIKGEEINGQLRAIVTAIDVVANSNAFEKASVGLVKVVQENTEEIKSFEGHYANVICRSGDKILFLKRANDKKIAPGQWCLPGGHIDAGETIIQAGARELKEEANIDCDAACLWISSKAKCDDGKWAFYLNGCYPEKDSIALLDGESINAAWMTKEEWMDADLFFDLKDHLIAMEFPEFNVDSVPTISKAEDADFFFDKIEKAGPAAAIGEVRTWGGVQWKKESKEKWKPLKKNHRLAIADVTAHAENTSSGQLGRVHADHPDSHIRDAAKRELERRKTEKDKGKEKLKAASPAAVKEAEPVRKKATKPVKYTANEYLTDPAHKKIEKDFGKQLNKGFEFARGQYHAMFGNILNTDNARELAEPYKKDRSISMAVHEPASAFIRKLYSLMLKEPVPKNKRDKVVFSAGGTGAGKTTGMGEHVATKKEALRAHIIYDTNMNTFSSAVDKIDKALGAGKNVSIIHTFRDPVDAFTNGAVTRAQRMEKEFGSGRTVPIGTHINTHVGANETIPKLAEHYAGNKKVQIRVIDNSRGAGKSVIVPIDFLKEKKYNAEDLKKHLNEHIDKLYGQGKVSESIYRGFKAAGD